MKRTGQEVYKYIMDATYVTIMRNDTTELLNYINSNYDIPNSIIMDILAGRTEETEATASPLIVFGLLDGIEKTIDNKHVKPVSYFFDEDEIKQFSKQKYKEKKLEFPLIIDAIRVDNDFWVGAADADWFILLRNARKIKYNPEIQRIMKTVQRHGNEFQEISTSPSAIRGIIRLYKEELYIPNAITLNISDDSEADFYYDEDNKELVIKSLDHFDILDGYNRYYGMSQQKNIDPNFNTNFVLQITNFSYEKGKQYIHQQDLKIKMKKVDAASMNIAAPENQVCERLNTDSNFVWWREIRRNGGNINFPIFASIIWRYYFENKLNPKNTEINQVKDEIKGKINKITDRLKQYQEKKLSIQELSVIMYYVRYMMDDSDNIQCIDKIPKVIEEVSKDTRKWNAANTNRVLRPKTVKYIQEVVESI